MRIGDRTNEIKGEDLKNLEYSKSTRHYEDECNMDAEISDLNEELLRLVKRNGNIYDQKQTYEMVE